MKVLSFGELLIRLAAPGYTRLFQKDSFDVTFCGGEANVAVSLANYGVESQFMTVLPNTDVGRAAVSELRTFGVDCSKVLFKEGRMGLYYLEKGASQRSSKVIYDRKYSAFAETDFHSYDWDAIFEGVDWFHFTGINPALSEKVLELSEIACKKAKEKGICISCDLNYRKNLWSEEDAKKTMSNLIKYVDVCVANEEDAEKTLGIKSGSSNIQKGEIALNEYEYIAKEISNRFGCKKVAITLRESFSANKNGWSAVLYDDEKKETVLSKRYEIDVVDRVGGGDSFTGALIYSLIEKMDNQHAIDFAVAASCLKHSIEGDFNRVTVSEVENLIMTGGNGRVQR